MIQLNQALKHLPENKVQELDAIIQRIVETGKAEIIILFGSYARGTWREHRGEERGKKSDYDILAITNGSKNISPLRLELRGVFSDYCTPVQLIVENIQFVNHKLEEAQYFFSDIKREGIVLYSAGNYVLADAKTLSATRRREIAEEDYDRWYQQAEDFFVGYDSYREKNILNLSAFSLQQTVEMCYTTIEMVFAHYNPHEHNLEVLRDRVNIYHSAIHDIYPIKEDALGQSFEKLNFAYIGGRYRSKTEFPISLKELDYWANEATKLLELAKGMCEERIAHLKELES